MDSGVLERVRQLHADVEQHRDEITRQMLVAPQHPRHQLQRDHFVLAKARQISKKSDELLDLYDDDDFAHAKDEQIPVSRALRDFEAQVAHLREYHRRHPQPPFRAAREELSLAHKLTDFAASENNGRCLDMQPHYVRYVTFLNETAGFGATAGVTVVDTQLPFLDFVTAVVDVLHTTPPMRKLQRSHLYSAFVGGLAQYLHGFAARVYPLQECSISQALSEVEANFRSSWNSGRAVGWEEVAARDPPGGRDIALMEVRIERLLELLPEILKRTVDFQRRKLTMSQVELENEAREELQQYTEAFKSATKTLERRERGLADDADLPDLAIEDEAKFENKKNLPLDQDGKPIPYWLYKLHGLHIKYPCEICTYTYYGEKAYSQHFDQPRHLKGLQRIGIPAFTEEMRYVTKRATVIEQCKRSQELALRKRSRVEEAEIEDAQGFVMTTGQLHGTA